MCVSVWLRPTEALARGRGGGVGGRGVVSLPLSWAASVCVLRLRPVSVWARGGAGGPAAAVCTACPQRRVCAAERSASEAWAACPFVD